MIFGKTVHQKREEAQARLKYLYENRVWFAWHPVQLNDGRRAWLTNVERDYGISITENSKEYYIAWASDDPIYYPIK